jgi:hypothetical protein
VKADIRATPDGHANTPVPLTPHLALPRLVVRRRRRRPARDVERDDVERLAPSLGFVAVYAEGNRAAGLEPLRCHRSSLEIDEPVVRNANVGLVS